MRTRTIVGLGTMTCATALVYIVGTRLSEQALNVLLGITCGIAASIPVSLGLLIALTRQRKARVETEPEEPGQVSSPVPYAPRPAQLPYPPVIVVAPSQNWPLGYDRWLPPGYGTGSGTSPRDWKIFGEEDDEMDA